MSCYLQVPRALFEVYSLCGPNHRVSHSAALLLGLSFSSQVTCKAWQPVVGVKSHDNVINIMWCPLQV